MLRKITELCNCITVMNNEGLDKLINCAKDISSNKNLRKPDCKLTPAQFERQTNQVLSMVNRGYLKECKLCVDTRC
ncbi:MAG: hypothetical protein HFE51_09200 [Clostridia bacterium]|nr:hypothetical protein [Clostridia bacterium]MCI9086575.1 hypothetical protein [Clostridia bacterium]